MFTRSFANAFTVSILGNTFRKKRLQIWLFSPKQMFFFFHNPWVDRLVRYQRYVQ